MRGQAALRRRAPGKPAKALAKELGMPYPTIMRERSDSDTGGRFGADALLPLMQACGSVLPLRCLAARTGCRFVAASSAFRPGTAMFRRSGRPEGEEIVL